MHFHILSPTESPRLKLDLRLGAGNFARDSKTGAFYRGKAFTISVLMRTSFLKGAAISFTPNRSNSRAPFRHCPSAKCTKMLSNSPPRLECSEIALKDCEPRMTVLSPSTAHWYGNHFGKFLGATRAHGVGTRGKRESTVSDPEALSDPSRECQFRRLT